MQITWRELPNRYQKYIIAFALTSPCWVASLGLTGLDIIYGLVFFIASMVMIFTTEKAKQVPDHSTVDHFEQLSRLNWYNLAPAASLVMASVLFVWAPGHRATIVFVMWALSCLAILFFSHQARIKLFNNLVVDYLSQKFPTLSRPQLTCGVTMIVNKRHISVKKLSLSLHIDASEAAKIRYLCLKYIENNLQPA